MKASLTVAKTIVAAQKRVHGIRDWSQDIIVLWRVLRRELRNWKSKDREREARSSDGENGGEVHLEECDDLCGFPARMVMYYRGGDKRKLQRNAGWLE